MPRRKSVPIPRGFKVVEIFEPQPEPPRDIPAEIRERAAFYVALGLYTPKKIHVFLINEAAGDLPAPELRNLAHTILDSALAAHAAAQKKWPKITDCDRLDRAFKDLEKSGILARHHYWCCSTCGGAAIRDEIMKRRRKNQPARGYTFYDEQGTESAIERGHLRLNYGTIPWGGAPSVAIGREVVKVLRARGLRPKWNGKLDQHITVPLTWQRRR